MMQCANLRILCVIALLAAGGCAKSGTPPPTTYAVRGKVVHKSGQPFTEGGAIQFKSTVEPSRVVVSEIKPDGSFTISMVHEDQVLPGTIDGPYRVMVIQSNPANPQNERVYDLKTIYTVEPKENELTVKLE